MYRGGKNDMNGLKEYRRYTLHNDHWNQRNQGRKKCRRNYYSMSISSKSPGVIFFNYDYDKYVFYVVPSKGNRNSIDHPPLTDIFKGKKNGIDDDEENFRNEMADSQAQDAQIQNIVANKA